MVLLFFKKTFKFWCSLARLRPLLRGGRKMELIVFTNNGQTYHFFEVEDFKPTTTGFSFTYTGKATGVTRKAVFNNTSTAGYALV